jgi:hypothetical protein
MPTKLRWRGYSLGEEPCEWVGGETAGDSDTDSDPQNNETQSERLRSYACKVPGVKVLCSHNPLREANQSA